MNRTQQEVALKNQNIHALNDSANSAYAFVTAETSGMRNLASEKYDNSLSGSIPEEMGLKEPGKAKEVTRMVIVALTVVTAAFLLIKYKIIKI